MGITVCKILHCCAEDHDPKKSRAFEYIYETGVDPDRTYMCMACRQRILGRAAQMAEARTGNLPKDMDRSAPGRAVEDKGIRGMPRPWQTVPRVLGGAEEAPKIDGAVTRKWGGEDDIKIVNERQA